MDADTHERFTRLEQRLEEAMTQNRGLKARLDALNVNGLDAARFKHLDQIYAASGHTH